MGECGLSRVLNISEASDADLRRILLYLALIVTIIDLVWAPLTHFSVAYGAYINVALLSVALFLGSIFYRTRRPEPALSAMLFGCAFLCLFSAAASVLNYCLLTVAGPRIDVHLAAMDRALGFYWPALMEWVARFPLLNMVLLATYSSSLPQVALLTVALGWGRNYASIYRFCIAVGVGALICICIWTLAPSFGAVAVYAMPEAARHMPLALDQGYANELVALLGNGTATISPVEVKGLIGFPSYHAVLALLTAYYAWSIAWLRWPALALNLLVLVATPIQGGHHLVDVVAGVVVTAFALFAAGERWGRRTG